jgi:hypothetical protein
VIFETLLANFAEHRKSEVGLPRIHLPGTWLNRPQGCIRLCYVPSFTDGKGFASKGRFLMVKLTVLYGHPDDPDAFEEYYYTVTPEMKDRAA